MLGSERKWPGFKNFSHPHTLTGRYGKGLKRGGNRVRAEFFEFYIIERWKELEPLQCKPYTQSVFELTTLAITDLDCKENGYDSISTQS